jgi:hypothetical protein
MLARSDAFERFPEEIGDYDDERVPVIADDVAIIWGRSIVERSVEEPGVGTIPAVALVTPKPIEMIRAALAMERRAGHYSIDEIARIVDICRSLGVATTEVVDLIAPDREIDERVSRYRALPDAIAALVTAGVCDLNTADRLATVPCDIVDRLACFVDRLSFSNRRRAFEYIVEITVRDGAPAVREMIERLAAIDDPKERLDTVRRVRYPTIAGFEARAERVRSRVLRGTGVRLDVPQNFEGDRYTVSFDFASTAQLERRVAALQRLVDESDGLLELLFGDDR